MAGPALTHCRLPKYTVKACCILWRHLAHHRAGPDHKSQHLCDRFGLDANDEFDTAPIEQGLLILKRPTSHFPVERVYSILNGGNTDRYLERYAEEQRNPSSLNEENVQC